MRRLLLVLSLSLTTIVAAESFDFVAIGDTAYNSQRDYPIYERLIGAINEAEPAFTIHVGDTWGVKTCTKEHHLWVRDWFDKYQHPVIYTPGDNEWTDCREGYVLEAYARFVTGKATPEDLQTLNSVSSLDGALAGKGYADTLKSLRTLRRVFFSKPRSQGAVKMPLTRQPDVSKHRATVENVRWEKAGVLFATVSVPGSQNGFVINDQRRAKEAVARNKANVDWIKDTFATAATTDAKAVVIAIHAGIFMDGDGGDFSNKRLRGGPDGPFYWIALAIRDLAAKYGKPVLLINGDFHEFVIDRPFFVSQGEVKLPKYGNVTRLQVYGAPELRAVKVSVDTNTPWVFSYAPLYVE